MSFPASKSNANRLRMTRASKQLKGFKPQLTSLIDVMTILLIYLLKSFSSEGEIITVSQDLVLPVSSAQKRPELMVTLVVNNSFLMVDDRKLVNMDELPEDELVIPQLDEWLRKRREATEKIGMYSEKTKFKGDILIQGDKRIHFRLLKRIMYTCGQQGYNNFSLAVRKKEE
ncbi:MAG: ExbD/TolR family protein [Chitinispirillaceae bacterium]